MSGLISYFLLIDFIHQMPILRAVDYYRFLNGISCCLYTTTFYLYSHHILNKITYFKKKSTSQSFSPHCGHGHNDGVLLSSSFLHFLHLAANLKWITSTLSPWPHTITCWGTFRFSDKLEEHPAAASSLGVSLKKYKVLKKEGITKRTFVNNMIV